MSATAPDLTSVATLVLDTLKTHLADPDPKVSLRAASELTKLLGTLARTGVLAEAETPAEVVVPPTPHPSPPVAAPPSPVSSGGNRAHSRGSGRSLEHAVPAGVATGPNSLDPSFHDALSPPPRPLPLDGPPLTSFLGPPQAIPKNVAKSP